VSRTEERKQTEAAENKLTTRIFEPDCKDVKGGYRVLHNDEHHGLYCSRNNNRLIEREMKEDETWHRWYRREYIWDQ
jgi:hypothetical protein